MPCWGHGSRVILPFHQRPEAFAEGTQLVLDRPKAAAWKRGSKTPNWPAGNRPRPVGSRASSATDFQALVIDLDRGRFAGHNGVSDGTSLGLGFGSLFALVNGHLDIAIVDNAERFA